ncbi:Cell wall protein AWA1-like isoform X1 [Phytophthora megakarya]|uniref:Cell wall protein AWA1-like isoform X1 n=1 Tax=Phytophthora megakarya TaxID=4795 RepID=A0A225W8N0_9STRA|nr:Cell wall protein AWA1-like isoform X1 [Phytophthora megakarya]
MTVSASDKDEDQVHEVTESSSDEAVEEEIPAHVVEEMRAGVFMPEPDVVYNTKNVADMHYLFTNDKLKDESPAVVLRSDPFCIPRVTDNVPNYRPTLNPLSIFLGEDQLLPGNFRLDPTERLPNVEKERRLPLPPGSSSSSTSSGKQRGKTSAFMGTMPRQTEFAEIPVSEKLFQNHEVFRPSPPIPRVPTSPREQRTRPFVKTEEVSTSGASLSDAMLLSSIQHTLDVTTAALASTDSVVSSLDSVADSTPTVSEPAPASTGYQIQPLQPLESVADTLTNYLPSRGPATMDRPVDGQYFAAAGGYNAASMSAPYPGLFVNSGETQPGNQNMHIFSSAMGSISITTPTNGAAGLHNGLITPQGGAVRSSEGTPRHQGAKKARAKNVFRPCTSPGCTKGARGKSGLCQKHGGGKRCAAPNCPKGAQGSSSMCLFHGGGYRCTVDGCNTGARGTSGLCAKHGGYKKGNVRSTGKRGPSVDGTAAKRVRTDEPQPPAVQAD